MALGGFLCLVSTFCVSDAQELENPTHIVEAYVRNAVKFHCQIYIVMCKYLGDLCRNQESNSLDLVHTPSMALQHAIPPRMEMRKIFDTFTPTRTARDRKISNDKEYPGAKSKRKIFTYSL